MRILVTGASGFIGSHLIHSLKSRDHEVFGVSRKPVEGNHLSADIRDTKKIIEYIDDNKIEVVFHLAAALGSHPGGKDYIFDVNFQATKRLASSLANSGIRFIFFSSTGVLGNVPMGKPSDENSPLRPESPYERSKALAEASILEAIKKGLNACIIRPGWVYGPGDRRTFKLFKFLRKNTPLFGSGRNHQHPVYIEDLVNGAMLLIKETPSSIYNLSGDEIFSLRDFVNLACRALKCRGKRIFLPVFPVLFASYPLSFLFNLTGRESPITPAKVSFFVKNREYSCERAKRELGFKPRFSFEKGMEITVNWYEKYRWF